MSAPEAVEHYYQAEVAFQLQVSKVGSVAARIEHPELAQRVIETFSKLGPEVLGHEVEDTYRRAREAVSLPTEKTIELYI